MRGWNCPTDIYVTPEQLRDFAWSEPMRDLAAKVGISDVGLKKILRSYNVATPPQGYWNKIRAGKPAPSRPRLLARRPGETGRVRVDQRFKLFMTPAAPMPANGPFTSAAVPEDLGALREQEIKAIGRATTPAKLDLHHPGLKSIMDGETRRRAKAAASSYHWDAPKFDNPLAQRRLRILNAIFLALAKRGHTGTARDDNGEIISHATIGDTYVRIELKIVGKHRTVLRAGYYRADPSLPASTPLALHVCAADYGAGVEIWQDDDKGKLEVKIAVIAASMIVAGEARFRQSLREAIEREERQRIAEEEARQRRLADLNRKRIDDLHASGELLRRAEDIRSLVARMRAAVQAGSAPADAATIEAWEHWALAEADKIDPVKSGQIDLHLRAPSLGGLD